MDRFLSRPRRLAVGAFVLVLAVYAASAASARPGADAVAAPPSAQRTLSGGLISVRPGTLRPGTIVRSSKVFKRVFLDSQHGIALAGVGQAQYPTATSDGGRTWRTSGPTLHINAAQAPLAVSEVGALSRRVYFAAGGGEVVDATPDGGKHWYQTLFPGGVLGAIPANGKLLAVVADNATSPANTWVYGSGDGGKTWHYEEGL
jgi:photosystem II stability/assembly factor-like uncharacterized protein